MNKTLLIMAALAVGTLGAAAALPQTPVWIESNRDAAIQKRVASDFSIPYTEGVKQIMAKYPGVTEADVRDAVNKHYIETMTIDGKEMMFRKAVRNFGLLNPAYNGGWKHRGWNASDQRIAFVDSVIQYTEGTMPLGGAHRVKIRFTIDVPYEQALQDDTVRVWMPYPIESARQRDIRLVSTSQPDYIISKPGQSEHRTIYMEQPVQKGKDTHFEYTVEFTNMGEYYSPEFIRRNIKPYDKSTEQYKKYTSFDGPHYVNLEPLARKIVGTEINPYRQSELVYDYIIEHYPWAGAREYSTIPCIPQYVVEEGHGDCGQVALLYISLMRSLGVPARWESGWMLHPGEKNYHDWAEVYFEGVGWVPVDVSFGRYTSSDDPKVQKFYSTGMDAHRFATNTGVSDNLYPAKKYVRSETVDLQAGEVECSKGNLFYPAWDHHLQILDVTPVEVTPAQKYTDVCQIIEDVRRRMAPDKRQTVYDIETIQLADGTTVLNGTLSDPAIKAAIDSLVALSDLKVEDHVAMLPDSLWAIVKISTGSMRTSGSYGAEMATQVLMGMPVRLLEQKNGWWKIQAPDGYLGWIWKNSLAQKTPEQMEAWRKADRLVVTSRTQVIAYDSPTATNARAIVSDLVPGSIVEGRMKPVKNGRVEITLPDGRKGWVDASAMSTIEKWASQNFDPKVILDQAYTQQGAPYLWGGTTAKATDCSGLVKVSYLANGLMLRRDASQQALLGEYLNPDDWRDYRAGDLLFFGEGKGRVTHVGIYDADGNFIHCAGRVHRSSLDPDSPIYVERELMSGARMHGHEGEDGITYVRDHPWYFAPTK